MPPLYPQTSHFAKPGTNLGLQNIDARDRTPKGEWWKIGDADKSERADTRDEFFKKTVFSFLLFAMITRARARCHVVLITFIVF